MVSPSNLANHHHQQQHATCLLTSEPAKKIDTRYKKNHYPCLDIMLMLGIWSFGHFRECVCFLFSFLKFLFHFRFVTRDTYLQVLSLSSSWRSLQYSSVCLQEHRQVAGSCTNKRFLLSEQWSQHGSQTLDTERQTRQRWGEADYHHVLELSQVSHRPTLWYAPLSSSKPTPEKSLRMWQSSSFAGRYSSSNFPSPSPHRLPQHPPPLIGPLTNMC